MIEKTVEALNEHFKATTVEGYTESKTYERAASAFPSILSYMDEDEVIIQAFLSSMLWKNGGRESITRVLNILTNKRYYFSGNDGKSSVFFPQLKSGSVELNDVHATTMGNHLVQGSYVSFETKNEDYKLMLGPGVDATPFKAYFDDAIKKAQNSVKNAGTTMHVALSSADEIKKFKELLDNGIITQEEFDAKKKQLLGL